MLTAESSQYILEVLAGKNAWEQGRNPDYRHHLQTTQTETAPSWLARLWLLRKQARAARELAARELAAQSAVASGSRRDDPGQADIGQADIGFDMPASVREPEPTAGSLLARNFFNTIAAANRNAVSV